ncbi:Unknown protein sequence [Pseudomonas syringae pv. maculicola]|nr:Unknown protein sequence [Pseudomonas syringae pv. maculicola]
MSRLYGLLLVFVHPVIMVMIVVMCGWILDGRAHFLRSRILLVAK